METLKKWGLWILGAVMFLIAVFAATNRRKEEPKPEAPQVVLPTDYQEKHDKIEEAHAEIIEKSKPIPKSNAASIGAAIEEYNRE